MMQLKYTPHHPLKSRKLALGPVMNDEPAVQASSDHCPETRVITDFESFVKLKDTWDRLLEEAGIEHPFLSHAWISCWWQCFNAGRTLYIVLIKDQGRVCSILPMMKSSHTVAGLCVCRLVSLFNDHTPRSGFIVTGNHRKVYAEFWKHLVSHRKEWDVLELCQVPVNSTVLAELPDHARRDHCPSGVWIAAASPYLPLTGSWEAFQKGLRGSHRTNIKRQLRRLTEIGMPELETITGAGLDEALDDGFRLEAIAWKGKAGTAIAVHPSLRRFYTQLAGVMAKKNCLRLHFLRVNGRRIAFQYCLQFHNRLYMLKPGYDPAFARYSPSNLLTGMVLEEAFRSGLTEYDFLGQNDEWKLKWTRHTRSHQWLYVFSNSWRGRLLHFIKFRLKPAARNIRCAFSRPLQPQRTRK